MLKTPLCQAASLLTVIPPPPPPLHPQHNPQISKGCAEQLMSRDVRFLGAHTDFFRSLSLYATGPGHFINTWLTVQTIQLGVWVQLLLLLGGVGAQGGRCATDSFDCLHVCLCVCVQAMMPGVHAVFPPMLIPLRQSLTPKP